MISCKSCSELLNQGAQVYLIRIENPLQGASENQQKFPPPSPTSDILQQYQDIFEELAGLSPHRECDHKIPIKEGTDPPNVGPC